MASCPSCGAEIEAAAHFCPSCGAGLVGACPACGAETRVGAQFCASCGHRLDLAAPAEEERKLVTVLFADLTGSTALGERLDPERLRVLLADYFAAMASIIESWGGTVEKFVGDAVMAVFGIPAMHEDDAERGLRAALEMQARLGEMNPELAERHGVELAMRVGVNTGEVIAGTGGDQFMVTGDVVNVAARLQQTADPGEVVAGERTYLSARGAYVFEPLEEKTLKGKALPVRAWRLIEKGEVVRQRGVPGVSTRLIGRERELGLLDTLYRRAVEEARPGLVTILGQAGIGKTRLTEEFVGRAEADTPPAAVYRGRCLPYGEGITYWALREILWAAGGIMLDDSGTAAREKLERLVRGLLDGSDVDAAEADRVLFALAKTAGISVPANPLDRMSPESIGEELGLAWPRFLSALAVERRTLVVIDDLHRAEPPLLDMIERLVSRSTGRALLVATARPEFVENRPGWSSRHGMSQISLEPLTESDAQALLVQLVPDLGPRLRERVLAAAEGNPLFAEEIVAHLIDKGVLERAPHAIVEVNPDAPVTIPDTVRGVLAARVDALPSREKRVLQDAAVIGRTFWATTLESMHPDGGTREALDALEDKALIVTRSTSALPGQTELSFRHGLARDVAYQSIPKGRRARAHADVARWIERLTGDRREEYVDLIAHHYESAAIPEDAELAWPADASLREEIRSKAIAALLEAGRAATARFAIDQALGFGSRALELARTDVERLGGLELKAQAAHAAVRADEAWSYYTDALQIAERLADAEVASRLRANITLLWSRYGGAFTGDDWKPVAVGVVERGLEEAGEESPTFETGALLAGRSGFRWWKLAPREKERARADAERAVEIAQMIGSPILLSYALDSLTANAEEDGFCESADLAERTLRAGESIEDRVGAHEMLVTSAIAFSQAGRFEAAASVAEQAAALAANLGPHQGLHAGSAQTSSLLPPGRLEELREATAQAPDLVLEEGMHTCMHGLAALAGQALAAFETGYKTGAARALEIFDSTARTSPSVAYAFRTTDILRPLVGAHEARRRLEDIDEPTDARETIFKLRAELQVYPLTAEWDQFERVSAEARPLARRACAPYLEWIADWGEAVRLATSGSSAEALAKATAALASLEEFGERYTAALLLADLAHFLDGEAASGAAAEAARRLEAMGARASAAKARELRPSRS
jgi:class 3 adenylate cyclase